MTSDNSSSSNRRDFLTGKVLRSAVARAGDVLADQMTGATTLEAPEAAETVRLGKEAMACRFDVILNPGNTKLLQPASEALDLVDELEDQLSLFRAESEISLLNQNAGFQTLEVESRLFELLLRAETISRETEGGFDPTSGPPVELWRQCKAEGRIPTETEIAQVMQLVGMHHVELCPKRRTVRFSQSGVQLNLNSIGKGYALDRSGELLLQRGVEDWLLHGGHSSLLARGKHADLAGWPVGIRHPLFPDRRIATVLLSNCGMSSSGSGVQYFRHRGKRFGHILDPRTGRPVQGMLSATVFAPTAAEADALSTAFFVIGVEKARQYCHTHSEVSAVLIASPARGSRLEPIVCSVQDDTLFFTPDDVVSH